MIDPNFNEIFGNKLYELEKKLQGKSIKVVNKEDSKEYDLYDLLVEYKNIIEYYYENNIKNYYINYKNFTYYFNEFLLRFKKHGIDYNFEVRNFEECKYVTMPLWPFTVSGFCDCIDFIFMNNSELEICADAVSNVFNIISYSSNLVKTKIAENYSSMPLILNSDDFAKIVFSYSSYSALMDSIDIYVKSVHSGKIKEFLPSAATVVDSSSFFTKIKCPMGKWPMRNYNPDSLRSLIYSSILFNNEKYLDRMYNELSWSNKSLCIQYLNLTSTYIFWISESGINIVNSIMNNLIAENSENNFDLIYLKSGNEYLASVARNGEALDKVLDYLDLSRYKILSRDFLNKNQNKTILNICSKIILEQHNLCFPVVKSICIKKIDNIKNKYTKALNLSAEDSNSVFEQIYSHYSMDNLYSVIGDDISGDNFSSNEIKGCLFNNENIIKKISSNDALAVSYEYDYIDLLKKSIDYDVLYNNIKEAILTADKEIDISEIFLNYLNSILDNYSNKIKEIYENPNSFIYSDIEKAIPKKYIKEDTLTKIIGHLKATSLLKEDSGDVDDSDPAYKILFGSDLDLDLKIIRFSSRMNFLNGRSYKEFLESEKNKTQKIEDEIAKLTDIKNDDMSLGRIKIIESQKLNILLSKLITDNFKKEGQLLQTNSDQELTVKIPEYSEEKKTKVFNPKNISFAKLSVLLRLDNTYPYLLLPTLFSEFLDDLRRKEGRISGLNAHMNVFDNKDMISIPIILALFWMKKLSKPEEISSTESLERNLLSFLENLPLMMSITHANESLLQYIQRSDITDRNGSIRMGINFINQSKFSKIETFKNLSSLIKFYHNNESYNSEKAKKLTNLISNSKNLNKLYLNNYQVFLQSFIDFNSLLENTSGGIQPLSPSELKEKIYNLKEKLKKDRNIGPEKTEKLLPQDKIDGIHFFKLKTCEMTPASFDEAFDKMEGNFDPKDIASLNNIISTIKQIETIKEYISYAKPKDELVLDNNYMFTGSNNSKFRFRTLGDIDPQHFSIGVDTNCCQRIGGAGEAAAIDSFINPTASVIILEVNSNSRWNIISQSYFHVVSEGNYFILDNIEAGKYDNDSLKSMISFDFFEVYGILAKELLAKGFKKVLCGTGYTKVLLEGGPRFKMYEMDKDPRHFEVEKVRIKTRYTDFMANGSRKSFDLGSPNFEIPEVGKLVFAASIDFKTNMLLKISNSILIKKTDNLNLIKLSKYLNSVNLTTYSSRVLLLEE